MKNTFVKILCLSLALMMLLASCNNSPAVDGTTESSETPSESTTPNGGGNGGGTENLFKPVSSQQILFDLNMDVSKYISGLGTAFEVSVAEVDGKAVLKVVCKKKSGANIVFDYAKYMSDYGIDAMAGEGIYQILAMQRVDDEVAFTRNTVTSDGSVTLGDDGKLSSFSLKCINSLRKNQVMYISSIALITSFD